MKQYNERNKDTGCSANERMPELVCVSHVGIDSCHLACLGLQADIRNIAELGPNQSPDDICQRV